jgi:hypothetical protein
MSYADLKRDQEFNAREERRDAHKIARAVSGLLTVVKVLRAEAMPQTAQQIDTLAQELLSTLPADIAEMVRSSVT